MESANHEFTWLSGHPQMSTSFVREEATTVTGTDTKSSVLGTSTQPPSSLKPTPLPRQQQKDTLDTYKSSTFLTNNGTVSSSSSSKRPVPLPRGFCQRPTPSSRSSTSSSLSSSDGTPFYDVPPPPPPPPPLPPPSFLRETTSFPSASNFYIATNPNTYNSPVSKSVIFEFDPIMQAIEPDTFSENDVTHVQTDRLSNSSDIVVDESEPECVVSGHERFHSSSGSTSSINSERGSYEIDNELTKTVLDDQSTEPLFMTNGAQQSPKFPHPRTRTSLSSPQIGKKNVAIIENSPQLPPKSPVTKTPKFGLSSVPPPPNQTGGEKTTTSSSSNVVKVPIHVDNPCYMFVTPGGKPQNYMESSGDESDDDSPFSVVGGGQDPPKFPPPPLPTSQALLTHSSSSISAVDEAFYTPPFARIIVDVNKCPPAPKALRKEKSFDANDTMEAPVLSAIELYRSCFTNVEKEPKDSTTVENVMDNRSKPKYPIYQNLLEISGSKEGVYARINKTMKSKSTSSTVLPPPLPPRGQQKSTTTTTTINATEAAKMEQTPAVTVLDSRNRAQAESRRSEQLNEVLRNIPHRGVLYKIGRGRKEISQKWVLLERGHLQVFADEKSENPQDIFHHSDMICIAKGPDTKYNNQELSSFELVTTMSKERPHVFGAKYISERDSWMQHIFQSIAPSVAITDTRGVVKAGYVKARKSISGVWQTFWLVLVERSICLWPTNDATCLELDLRKVISMQAYETDPQASMMTIIDGPLFVIHYPALTVYISSKVTFDTTDWFNRIRQASLQHGSSLEEQQLTHEDVPVIVDKCIKFIGTYGISTKGIYRESGTSSKITRLLDNLRKDAWKVHIQLDEYSEHDVANVLKRFLRTLPNALLMRSLYSQWISAAGASKVEASSQYAKLLGQLPKINYLTVKKLVAHLRSVCELDKVNLMDVSNVAAVFGPSLMSTEGDMNLTNSTLEMDVISSLISNYPVLFGVSAEEIAKEEKIQKALQELREARRAQKPAGDILVGIYVHNREWGKCLNVKLSPSMTALDLLNYAVQQLRMKDRFDELAVFEVVCNGEMERPVHYSEIVLAVTLRWASWSDSDAKDSYLLIKKTDLFLRVLPMMRQPLTMFGELRFADIKSKSFKKFMFEFKKASLAYYKDAKISQPIGSWNIEDITWYIGCDCRRQPHTEWSITFIEQKAVVKRGTKETPFFGRTICFSSEEELYRWIAAMLTGQYPNGIIPKIEPLDLLT